MTEYSRAAANLAALPWYDFPSTRQDLDAVWRETRSLLSVEGIRQIPVALSHTTPGIGGVQPVASSHYRKMALGEQLMNTWDPAA